MEIPIEVVRGNMLPPITTKASYWSTLFSVAVDCITEVTAVTREEILGANRQCHIIDARFMAYKIARDEFCSDNPPPHQWIAAQFARRKTGAVHHGTIIHGIRQLCNRLQTRNGMYITYCDVLRIFEKRRAECLDVPEPKSSDNELHGLRAAADRVEMLIKANQGYLDSIVERLDAAERRRDENMVQN